MFARYAARLRARADAAYTRRCGNGCLFELRGDPLETADVAAQHPEIVATMHAKLTAYEATAYNPHRGKDDGLACEIGDSVHGGFWGPFVL